MSLSIKAKCLAVLIISTFLIACGGGGGGGSASYIAPSLVSTTYSGNQQTKTYSDGSNVTNTASGSSASYASDHTTRTTVYNYSDGGSNSVVDTVSPTAGSPTYVGNTQTIVTTYGDGYTTTANNTATGSSISWASDHTTRTTTYTFANGGTNAVVATVNPTVSTPALTAANYPGNWTTTGTVTAPSVSAKNNVYGDGYTAAIENGTSSKPFLQTTLSALSISDPSSYVTSSTATYNLNWGTPDKSGPAYANIYPNASNTLGAAKSYAGISVAGQTSAGPTLLKPSADVLAGWNSGWTGKDVNILVIDSFANRATCSTVGTCHGIVSMMATDYISPGANKFGLDATASNGSASFFTGTGFTSANAALGSSKSINIINMSWHFTAPVNDWSCNNGCGVAPTNTDYTNGITATQTTHNNLIKVLNGESSVANLSNFSNAVLTKSAGNDALDTKYDLTALALSANASTQSRLLIVGALDKDGTVASKASKAPYTNTAGTNTAISDRFVMANGTMPWNSTGVKINGTNMPVASGTSFAAPLVAGYTAIVMQKFPNLDAAKTSNIILDTARTDTLSCSPNCDPAIYGKGEASLSRALAPVGRLR